MRILERFVLRNLIGKLFNIDFSSVVEDVIRNIRCDTVNIEGLTSYYKKLDFPQQQVANNVLRLILAYLLNRAGVKVDYDKIKR